MKNLTLLLAAATALPFAAQGGDDVIPLDGKSRSAIQQLYRPVGRGTMVPANRPSELNGGSGGGRGRQAGVYLKPTQHYYTKSGIISYRYAEESKFASARGGRSYLGPNAAYIDPHREGLAPNVSVRTLAHVEPIRQPGVPMNSTRWSEVNINSFNGDAYYRRVEANNYYHGGNVNPESRGSRTERVSR